MRAGTASAEQIGLSAREPLDHHLVDRAQPGEGRHARVEGRDGALGRRFIEIAPDQRGEPLVDLRALGLIGGAQAHRLEEEDARELAIAREGLEPGPQRRLHLAEGAVGAGDGVGHGLGQTRREVVYQREEERFLVREVVVHGALGGTGGAHDVVHEGLVIPFAGEYRQCRMQNALASGDPDHEETRC